MTFIKGLVVGAVFVVFLTASLFAVHTVREQFSFAAWVSLFLAVYLVAFVVFWPLRSQMEHLEGEGHRQILWAGLVVLLLTIGLATYGLAVSWESSTTITCSMYHNASFEEWWPHHAWKYPNISREEFQSFPFADGLTQRDAQLRNASADEVDVGDVLVFQTYSEPAVIGHRVIAKWETQRNYTAAKYGSGPGRLYNVSESHTYFTTYGDNEFVQMPYERKIKEEQVIGVMAPREDNLAWFNHFLRQPCGGH